MVVWMEHLQLSCTPSINRSEQDLLQCGRQGASHGEKNMPQNKGTLASVFSTTVECSWQQESGETHEGRVGLDWMLCPNKSVGAACILKYYQYATKLVKIGVFK